MSSETAVQGKTHRHMGLIVGIGLIAILGMVGYILWSQGAFKKHEKIAIITWNQDPFWEPVQQGADDAAKEFGVDLTFIQSKPDLASQNQHIKEVLDAGTQGLALSPNNPKSQESVLNDAAGKAVLVTFDSDAPNTKRRGFVGTNDYAAGQVAGEQVKVAIPDGGGVIISVGSVEMSNGRDRRQGVIDDLLDRPMKLDHTFDPADAPLKGGKYNVLATVTDNGDGDKAVSMLTDAIKANGDVKCIVGLFSYSGPAILKAIDAAGKKGQIKIVGFDESAEEQAAVASGAIASSVLQDQYRCGYETVRVLAELVRGTQQNGSSGTRLTELPVLLMQADNIKDLREQRIIRKVSTQ